jgi:hypothetical protein
MTSVSPAAQAVFAAYHEEAIDYIESWGSFSHKRGIAAALRAAADQLVPAKFYNVNGGDRTVWETKRKVRDDLLVIAAELENQ